MSFAPVEHVLGVARFLIVACGPLPLCIVLTAVPAPRSAWRRLLAVLVLWCVVQADLALLAGLLHRFEPATVLVGQLLLLVVGGAALVRRAALSQAVADARLAARRMSGPERMVAIALGLVGISLLWHVAAVPVIDWDSWSFHMPAMAGWLQAGQFVQPEQFVQRARSTYPYTWEAVCALFLMPFGEDAFVTFPNLVVWGLLGLATATAARDLSAGRLPSLAAAAFVMSMPHLQGQVNSLHVDVPFAAFAVAALSLALAFERRGRRSDLALLVAALGFLCGLRATGPVYAAAIVALLLALRRWGTAAPRSRLPAPVNPALAVFCVASSVFIATFWWMRNVVGHGNPLPLPLAVSPDTGRRPLVYVVSTSLAFAFDPFALASWKHVAGRAWNEIGLPLPIILAQLALCPAALRSGRKPHAGRAVLLAAILVIGSSVLFMVTPTSAVSGIQFRLGFPALAALAIAGAVVATHARLPGLVCAFLAIAAAVVTTGYSRVFQMGAVLLIPIVVARHWRPSTIGVTALVCLLAAGFTLFALAARERRAGMRLEYYGPGFAYLEQHIGEDEPVGYLLSNRSYYFYGTRLRRPVRYVPTRRWGPTPEWFERLRSERIRAVIVGPYDDSKFARQTVDNLAPPDGRLVRVFGHGRPDEITVYRVAEPPNPLP